MKIGPRLHPKPESPNLEALSMAPLLGKNRDHGFLPSWLLSAEMEPERAFLLSPRASLDLKYGPAGVIRLWLPHIACHGSVDRPASMTFARGIPQRTAAGAAARPRQPVPFKLVCGAQAICAEGKCSRVRLSSARPTKLTTITVIQLSDGRGIFFEVFRSAFRPLSTASTLLAVEVAGGHSWWAELPLRPESSMSIRLQGLAEERSVRARQPQQRRDAPAFACTCTENAVDSCASRHLHHPVQT
ncbi:hypothetical protein IF1G_11390 [Cordyceps javanica]|uniref:Uncharacterized protein n=1 Tax=Cordyceps javanica TaxID=43265 RepID=A0A545UKG2_9HYPO|nr:hypothetical protein IF1G_11390 [Cordyceps javanica]